MTPVAVRQRIDAALTELKSGLNPFVAAQMKATYHANWIQRAKQSLRDGSFATDRSGTPLFDITGLCNILLDQWQSVFAGVLGRTEQQLVHRIRVLRNEFAHQKDISADAAIGDFEAIINLLTSVGAGTQAAAVQRLKEETGRERYGTAPLPTLIESEAVKTLQEAEKSLLPWRDVIAPHSDVQSRRFVNAEFAANLFEVWQKNTTHQNVAGDEYADPHEFFARTYLTSGLLRLLRNAALRLSGRGGEPVVELQTSFGGGKTHALLALYHLASGVPMDSLPGIREALKEDGLGELPAVRRVVLVGTQMQAGQPVEKPDGTIVRTIWGELAYQLGGAEAFSMVAGADRSSTGPGAALGEVLKRYGPCVILIDEWVAYARQLSEDTALSGGTFETQFTFAQTLTESVEATTGAMLVLTLPMSDLRAEPSDIEVGGRKGREALSRLRNVIGRSQANWQPADPGESYAIVRRRLFEPMQPSEEKLRDRAVAVIHRFYREKEASFPKHASDPSYKQRLTECYPLHPELFELLYKEWGSLEQFQRTRGVLRLMAAAIHTLWTASDRAPLITPGTLPLEDSAVKSDLTRYLGNQNQWDSVLSRDVVGGDSVARRIDEKDKRLGRFTAAQRTAKTIFLATAPQHSESGTARGGIDIRAIRLGCVFPSEQIGAFDDAVRRLKDEGTHVNSDGTSFWFGLVENLNQRVSRLATQLEQHIVDEDIAKRLAEWQRDARGLFTRVQAAPHTTADVPDEAVVRLILLGADVAHRRGRENSSACELALKIVAKCGEADRKYKNCLLFLAPDETRLDELRSSIRTSLAWKKILEDKTIWIELTGAQQQTARERSSEGDKDVNRLLRAAWSCGFSPEQEATVGAPITLAEIRVEGGNSAAEALSRKLEAEGKLVPIFGGVNLRLELDRKFLWRDRDHVPLRELTEDVARYPYVVRLKDEDVLSNSIRDGLGKTTWDVETFAYADAYDEVARTYLGLAAGANAATAQVDMVRGLLVKPDIASAQFARARADADAEAGKPPSTPPGSGSGEQSANGAGGMTASTAARPHRFFQRITVTDPTLLPRVVNKLANDIVALLAAKGAQVDIAIDVSAELSAGIDQPLEERLRANSAAHEFPAPEFDA